jgi:hypothetical protein
MLGYAHPKHATMRESQITRRHDQDYIINVKQFLSKRYSPWLMVFDNCDDTKVLEDLTNYFPSGNAGHIIVTSRRDEAMTLIRDGIYVRGLEDEEAIDLLLAHAMIKNPDEKERRLALEVVRKLDKLALAVDLAGGYIRQRRRSLGDYLKLYEDKKEEVLEKMFKQQKTGTYPNTVYTAWELSISVMSDAARKLIYLISFLDRTNIRLDLFSRCCATRRRWAPDGTIKMIEPEDAGVPEWLTSKLLSENKNYLYNRRINPMEPKRKFNNFAMGELTNEICSFSFAKMETPLGDPLYEYTDGTVLDASGAESEEYRTVLAIHPLLHEIARLYLDQATQDEFQEYAERILWHSIDDDADTCFRNNLKPKYTPMVTLAGGATTDPVRLALRLDETYRHLNAVIKKGLLEKMTEVPESGSFASLLVVFDLLYLIRTAPNPDDPSKPSRDPFTGEQSCGWDKLNNEIKRARLLVRPNIMHQWMTIAARAPEIWRKEFEKPSPFEQIAKAEKSLYTAFKRKEGNKPKWEGFLDERKLLQGQQRIEELGDYPPMWNNVLTGAKAIGAWDVCRPETKDMASMQNVEWIGNNQKPDPKWFDELDESLWPEEAKALKAKERAEAEAANSRVIEEVFDD